MRGRDAKLEARLIEEARWGLDWVMKVRFGDGYLMVGTDGGIFNFSDREFFGSLGDRPPASPIVSVAALEG